MRDRSGEGDEEVVSTSADTRAEGTGSSRTDHGAIPLSIGKYRILGLIGEGGMGSVYKAEQDSPRRTVALKVIKAGVASGRLLQRFEIEAQILGKLDHPGIATIYEAGTFGEGRGAQPFFAMEFIEGQELLDYADSKKLGTRERLKLLAKIAQAVQHAHQKGVIHRDLKPGNILVNKGGQVKVLDFGVARATDADIQTATMQTDIGQLIGTLPYMSPEQASGNPDDLDTRSDVYALGVIAYELLTGQMPYDLRQKMIHEAVRVIQYDEPRTLSTVNRTFRGDIEIIVGKALTKEKDRRYQSASALAEDIGRYLHNEPIEARPPSTWYQLSKFSRRNRALVAGVIAVLIVSIAGALISINFAMGEAEQKQIALDAAEEARIAQEAAELAQAEEAKRADELQQVADFQSEQLGQIEVEMMGLQLRDSIIADAPEESRAALSESLASVNFTNIAMDTLEANIFTRTIVAIDSQFADQPLVQAQMLQTTSSTLRELGLLDLATDPQTRALSIRRAELGDDHPGTLRSISDLGLLLRSQGNTIEAELYLRQALEGRRRVLGNEHRDTHYSVNELGLLLWQQGRLGDQSKLAEAEAYFRESLEGSRRVLGDDHPETLTSIGNLGALLLAQGKVAESEPYFRETLEGMRRDRGDDHPSTLTSINNLGMLLRAQGKLADAELYFREAMEGRRRVLGDDHPDTLNSINGMGKHFFELGKFGEAESYYLEALEARRRVVGDDHPATMISISELGVLFYTQGMFDEAERYFREGLEISLRVYGDDNLETMTAISNMISVLDQQDKWFESEELRRLRVDLARRAEPKDDSRLGSELVQLGLNLLAQDRPIDAEPVLAECLEVRRRVLPEGHWLIWTTQSLLGETLAKQSKFVEAEGLLVEAAQRIQPPDAVLIRRDEAIRRVVDLYRAWHEMEPDAGHAAEAERWSGLLEEAG